MDWSRRPGLDPTDPNGIADLLARACDLTPGQPVRGTRFLSRTKDMVTSSREIERQALLDASAPLYVGVQHAHRLMAQQDLYESLLAAGVEVFAFGSGGPPALPVRWVEVADDPLALHSQWFVVREGDRADALVGFELPSDDRRRRWEGFRSHDPRLVRGLVSHLRSVADATLSGDQHTR